MFNRIFLYILIFLAVIAAGISAYSLTVKAPGKEEEKIIMTGELRIVRYSPGYSDMDGASHSLTLKKNDEGDWVIICRDRDSFEEPMTETVFAVSDGAVLDFDRFLKENNVVALSTREESDEFATDYSAWGYSFDYDDSAIGGDDRTFYGFSEYKKYSDEDYELLKELRSRLEALKGEMISYNIDEEN